MPRKKKERDAISLAFDLADEERASLIGDLLAITPMNEFTFEIVWKRLNYDQREDLKLVVQEADLDALQLDRTERGQEGG